MQPQQPFQQPPQGPQLDQTPYDFIMNAGTAPKATGGGPNSLKQRLLFVGGIFALLIVLGIVMVAVLSGGNGSSDNLLRVQQIQRETARVSQLAARDVGSQTVRNAAVNTQLSTTTDRQLLSAALAVRGITFTEEELALGANFDVEGEFETAQAAGTIDTTALTYLQEQVALYETALAEAFESASSEELRTELNRAYESTQLLRTQLDATNP